MPVRLRGAAPPELTGPAVEISRITSADPRSFTIIARVPWGVYFHWYGGRSRECACQQNETETAPPEQICERCKLGWPRKWRAYLHCAEHGAGRSVPVILEITDHACQQLVAQTMNRVHLRGVMMKVRKSKGGKHGRFVLEVMERTDPIPDAVPEIEPIPILKKLWDLNEERLKKMNGSQS